MKSFAARPILALATLLIVACDGQTSSTETTSADATPSAAPIALVIHGGAGTIRRQDMTPDKERLIRATLQAALEAGYAQLQSGASSVDAVIAAIIVLEDDAEFNAGRGAVLNYEGTVELDASIMDGATLQAGAIAGASVQDGGIRYPIRAARAVMDHSPHVLLSGEGAEAFAKDQGLTFIEADWFITERRYKAWQEAQSASASLPNTRWYSTVGAVALDQAGNLAAGTSTGGMTNKRWGRIGDSPIIGAGTYANNDTCGVSATGHGEFFIRHVVAYDICARVGYQNQSIAEAANTVVNEVLMSAGGLGGVIAMDKHGNIAMPFNTEGMYRGSIDTRGNIHIAMYADEDDRP
jgi:beta-aspartyl-peptidase (threonine type)